MKFLKKLADEVNNQWIFKNGPEGPHGHEAPISLAETLNRIEPTTLQVALNKLGADVEEISNVEAIFNAINEVQRDGISFEQEMNVDLGKAQENYAMLQMLLESGHFEKKEVTKNTLFELSALTNELDLPDVSEEIKRQAKWRIFLEQARAAAGISLDEEGTIMDIIEGPDTAPPGL